MSSKLGYCRQCHGEMCMRGYAPKASACCSVCGLPEEKEDPAPSPAPADPLKRGRGRPRKVVTDSIPESLPVEAIAHGDG